jgi:hypothetical protein
MVGASSIVTCYDCVEIRGFRGDSVVIRRRAAMSLAISLASAHSIAISNKLPITSAIRLRARASIAIHPDFDTPVA